MEGEVSAGLKTWLESAGYGEYFPLLEMQGYTTLESVRERPEDLKLIPRVKTDKLFQDQILGKQPSPALGLKSAGMSAYKFTDDIQVIKKKPVLVLLGDSGHGKSTLGNSFLDKLHFRTGSDGTAVTTECSAVYIPELKFGLVDVPGFCEVKSGETRTNEDIINKVLSYIDEHELQVIGFIICSAVVQTPRLPQSWVQLYKHVQRMQRLFQEGSNEGVFGRSLVFPTAVSILYDPSKGRYETKLLEAFALERLNKDNPQFFVIDWKPRYCVICHQVVKSLITTPCRVHQRAKGATHILPRYRSHPVIQRYHPGVNRKINFALNLAKCVGVVLSLGIWRPSNHEKSCCGRDVIDAGPGCTMGFLCCKTTDQKLKAHIDILDSANTSTVVTITVQVLYPTDKFKPGAFAAKTKQGLAVTTQRTKKWTIFTIQNPGSEFSLIVNLHDESECQVETITYDVFPNDGPKPAIYVASPNGCQTGCKVCRKGEDAPPCAFPCTHCQQVDSSKPCKEGKTHEFLPANQCGKCKGNISTPGCINVTQHMFS